MVTKKTTLLTTITTMIIITIKEIIKTTEEPEITIMVNLDTTYLGQDFNQDGMKALLISYNNLCAE